jgi:hypothetical protein
MKYVIFCNTAKYLSILLRDGELRKIIFPQLSQKLFSIMLSSSTRREISNNCNHVLHIKMSHVSVTSIYA